MIGRRARALAPGIAVLGAAVGACAIDRVDEAPGAARWTVHGPGVADRDSSESHAKALRARRYAPMLDGNAPDACGRCHDGVVEKPPGVRTAAPGAKDCRSCHDGADGVLACPTCHTVERSGAHAMHVSPSGAALACGSCHPAPAPGAGRSIVAGAHANGVVEIAFDGARVGREASYERDAKTCAVSCHNRGGARARPRWSDSGPMRCGDCHGAPPAAHPPGPCSSCHREADGSGAALSRGPLHMNGRVDLGDGTGACGACHGAGEDAWPSTGAHRAHATPALTTPIACATCHAVPSSLHAPGHLDGTAGVTLSGRALDRGARASYAAGTCAEVACHGARLGEPPAILPRWTDGSGAARACTACHGAPPSSQHTVSTSCDRAECHGGEVSRTSAGLAITAAGRALHVDGIVQHPRH